MSIDERLDRLAARHEALTQSVELLVHSQQEMYRVQGKHDEAQRRNEEMQRKNEQMLAQVVESIDSLARIAHVHEQRISGLEGGLN